MPDQFTSMIFFCHFNAFVVILIYPIDENNGVQLQHNQFRL